MPATETIAEKPQPEVVLASKAEQRLGSRDGRPATNQSSSSRKNRAILPNSRGNGSSNGIASPVMAATSSKPNLGNAPSDNTPRDNTVSNVLINESPASNATADTLQDDALQHQTDNSIEDPMKQILDEDELFMTLTDDERKEWEAMMLGR
ncbi:hypothetical protein PoB_002041700 [Plakobranchus ocellatus]|uniref:Uncharacterized protein n=1 Tax=Plakobranchus ocellatus TaxID=259542 RepID=A0AAV3ZHD4_9GAST|nr:hypothetical protein PoB_002041700 [Plakobranchus ocellatus]